MEVLSTGFGATNPPHRRIFIAGSECLDTGRVVIGLGLAINPKPPVPTRDGERLQAALLEPRTSVPPGIAARVLGALWRWS